MSAKPLQSGRLPEEARGPDGQVTLEASQSRQDLADANIYRLRLTDALPVLIDCFANVWVKQERVRTRQLERPWRSSRLR